MIGLGIGIGLAIALWVWVLIEEYVPKGAVDVLIEVDNGVVTIVQASQLTNVTICDWDDDDYYDFPDDDWDTTDWSGGSATESAGSLTFTRQPRDYR